MREIRTRLNKHILKLVFSHLGRDADLDRQIHEFKDDLRKAGNEDERDRLINSIIGRILSWSDETDLGQKNAGAQDQFVEFLNKLSFSHERADEIVGMRNRLREMEQQQDRLAIINETIALLCQDPAPPAGGHRDVILGLLDYLSLPKETSLELEQLKQEIYKATDHAGCHRLLRKVSDIINTANERLQNEFREIRLYMSQVIGQLGELNENLAGSLQDQEQRFTESRRIGHEYLEQNELLQNKIDASSDINEIRECVNLHIAAVNRNLKAHLDKETRRHDKSDKRIRSMQREMHGMQKQCETLKQKLQSARKDALHDALTGLPNRLAFDERMTKERHRFERYQHPLTLAVIDIDHFKQVNDTWGHKAGDKVLKAMTEVCNKNIRNVDFLARFGGEEFVLLLPATGLEAAQQAMENLRAVIEECHFHYGDQTVPITVSIGLATFADGDTGESVFGRADAALYAAKGNGRNRCMTELELDSAA